MSKKVFFFILLGALILLSFMLDDLVKTYFIAFILAYLLHPVAKFISKYTKLKYQYSALIVFGITMVSVGTLFVTLIPKLYFQIELFIKRMPLYRQTLSQELLPSFLASLENINPSLKDHFEKLFNNASENATSSMGVYINYVWQYLLSAISALTLSILTPFLLFFALKDWPIITKHICNFFDKQGFTSLEKTFKDIDKVLSSYLRGILNVSIIQGIYYTCALTIINFDFALIVGMITGFAVMIPVLGPLAAFLGCLLVSFVSLGFCKQQLYIIIVYFIGQTFDSSVLTPKIIGDKIGIHPIIIIFVALAGGQLFGATGMLLALPASGVIKVLLVKALNSKTLK